MLVLLQSLLLQYLNISEKKKMPLSRPTKHQKQDNPNSDFCSVAPEDVLSETLPYAV